MQAQPQVVLEVKFKANIVGQYVADIVVENKVLLELKAVSSISRIHEAQTINYLKATGIRVALLINFAEPKAQIKRLVL